MITEWGKCCGIDRQHCSSIKGSLSTNKKTLWNASQTPVLCGWEASDITVWPNNSICCKSAKLELEFCKATALDANMYSLNHTHILSTSFIPDIVLGTEILDCMLFIYFFFKGNTAQAYHFFYMYFQLREKRTLLLQRRVTRGELLAMNCTVKKLLDSKVSIFLMLPGIGSSVDEELTGWERILLLLPLPLMWMNKWHLFLSFCRPNTT